MSTPTVSDLAWDFTFNEPNDYNYAPVWHASYPSLDIQFMLYIPNCGLPTQSALTALTSTGLITLGITGDIRTKPDMTLVRAGEGFMRVGRLVTNPDSGIMVGVNTFPPVVELEVAA